ncbi:MAG: hypothetical protein LAO07_01140 [Acidobacteriia bacterium]|nr:hypothetical protein [Terriglobia bacterium]
MNPLKEQTGSQSCATAESPLPKNVGSTRFKPEAGRSARLVLAAVVLAFSLFLASCGQDYFTFTGTPPGTFGVGLTATVGDVNHTTAVALTVQ